MLSHVTEQQYESCAQISLAHVSQPFFSLPPVLQTSCLQVPMPPPEEPPLDPPLDELPPPPQLAPQTEPTSPMQIESHWLLQQ
jgi:hypothetical protein